MPVDGVNGSGNNYNYEEDYETPEAGEEGWEEEGSEAPDYQAYDLTRQQWIDLLNKVDARNLPTENACLEIIRDAIRADSENDLAKESAKFQELYQALGSEADSILGLGDSSDEFGDIDSEDENQGTQPTRVEDGVNYFEAQEKGQEFNLIPTEEGGENVVETDGNVNITPLDPVNDVVTLSKAGSKLRVKIKHEGKLTVYTINLKKAAHIHIASDNVKGSVDNEKKKITLGVESTDNFISELDRRSMANKISDSIAKIGIVTYSWTEDHEDDTLGYDEGDFWGPAMNPKATAQYAVGHKGDGLTLENCQAIMRDPSHWADRYNAEANAVKDALGLVANAMKEEDPSKRKELWKDAISALDRWKTQDEAGGGHTNNQAQLLFNVLYGELGEEGLKEALKIGLISPEFSEKLISSLEARGDENNNLKNEIESYQTGGQGWSHESSSHFIRENLVASEEEAEDYGQ